MSRFELDDINETVAKQSKARIEDAQKEINGYYEKETITIYILVTSLFMFAVIVSYSTLAIVIADAPYVMICKVGV